MNEIIKKIENHAKSSTIANAIKTAVITAGVSAVILFGDISVTVGG